MDGQILWGQNSDPANTNIAVLDSNYRTKFKCLEKN